MFHKKAFRRYLACLLVVCSLLSLSAIAASPIEGRLETVTTQIVRESAEDFLNSQIDEQAGYEIVSQKALYGANDLVLAHCYFLRPEGYVIVDTNGMVTEAAFEATASYRALQAGTEKIYYTGALSYYVKGNENYRDIVSQETVSAEAVASALVTHREMVQSNAVKTSLLQRNQSIQPQSSVVNQFATGSLRKYSYNPNVICGSTAAAILLMYYRDYKDSWIVPSWHVTDTGESLINLLVPQINGDPPQVAYSSDVALGLNWYFRWRGISDQYYSNWNQFVSQADTYEKFLSYMLASTPVEVLINNHGVYGNHFVVAHGVQLKWFGGDVYSYYMFVGDGWGSNDVLISMSYIRSYAYIAEF